MKIKSFLMIFTMLAVSPVLFAQESSSWSDFCADVAWVKNSLKKKVINSLSELPDPELPSISFNGADVACWSVPAWASFGLWVKGFNFRQPMESTKTMFKVDQATKYTQLARLALNNKAYLSRLALRNSAKVATAAYFTGFAWHTLINSSKK